ATIDNPAILAVEAPEAILHCEALARLEGRAVRLHAAVEIIGVDRIRPAITQLLLDAASGEAQPRHIDERYQPIGVRDPEQDRGCVCHGAESLLAATQHLLCVLALGEVQNEADEAHGVPLQQRQAYQHWYPAPIPADKFFLERNAGACRQHLLNGAF